MTKEEFIASIIPMGFDNDQCDLIYYQAHTYIKYIDKSEQFGLAVIVKHLANDKTMKVRLKPFIHYDYEAIEGYPYKSYTKALNNIPMALRIIQTLYKERH